MEPHGTSLQPLAHASARTLPRIAVLPELVRNQIAAGEVIERPASVVKELLENALDAGATRILVELEEGGVRLVRVSDDGCGMEPADLPLALASHATSKLGQASDLEHIATLGFRGEALASIASVARCRLFSRPAARALGAEVLVEGGRMDAPREAGGPAGTLVEVRDLFYNTPARRRFLKTTATELGRCLDVIQRLALASEGIGLVATHDGRRLFDVEPGMDLRARVRRTFGAELADALVAVEARSGDTHLRGLVAPPRFARGDTTRQMWFLNGRPLRDKVLLRCLKDAYRGFVVDGRQPVAFLALSMDPAKVDVNVHPAKAEVRLREERAVFAFLVNALREGVRATDMATPGASMLGHALRREERERAATLLPHLAHTAPPRRAELVREAPPAAVFTPGALRTLGEGHAHHAHGHSSSCGSAVPAAAAAPGEVRGQFLQVARTYLLRAVEDGFEIVDQHALHERLTFEELLREVEEGKVEVQRRLVPELVEVGAAQARALEEHFEALARAGIQLERFGEATIAVQGLPARLRRIDAEGLVRDVLAAVERGGRAPGAREVLEEVLHSAACRASVMAGDVLAESEIRALLERAAELPSDQTCPHARPTRVRFTLADLERAFGRR